MTIPEFMSQQIEVSQSDWHALGAKICAGGMNNAEIYLYYKPSSGAQAGQVRAFQPDEEPEGFEVADPERLSIAWTGNQFTNHVRAILRRLPILPSE